MLARLRSRYRSGGAVLLSCTEKCQRLPKEGTETSFGDQRATATQACRCSEVVVSGSSRATFDE